MAYSAAVRMRSVFPTHSFFRPTLTLAVVCGVAFVLSVAAGCRSARVVPESSGTAAQGTGTSEPASAAREAVPTEPGDSPGGVVRDLSSGVQLNFPAGWTVEATGGALPATVIGPGSVPVRVSMRAWDGDADALQASVAGSLTHLSSGPYASLETLADSPPLVHSTPYEDDDGDLAFAWFFTVAGRGLAIEARIPAADFESGWRMVDSIVRSATRSVGGGG